MMQDILRETEIYQYIMQEGVEKGQQQELQDLRQILMGFVQARFPELVSFANKQISDLTSVETLKDLTLKVVISQTSEEAHKLLFYL